MSDLQTRLAEACESVGIEGYDESTDTACPDEVVYGFYREPFPIPVLLALAEDWLRKQKNVYREAHDSKFGFTSQWKRRGSGEAELLGGGYSKVNEITARAHAVIGAIEIIKQEATCE